MKNEPKEINAFAKDYMRDTTITIQESWGRGIQRYSREKFGWVNPYAPMIIDAFYQGSIAIWQSVPGIEWYRRQIHEENIHHPETYWSEMSVWEKQVAEIQESWSLPYFETADDLEDFVRMVDQSMIGYLLYYYSVLDEKTPAAIQTHASAIRERDVFFSSVSGLIRRSLVHIYPDRAGVETAILTAEIHNPPPLAALRARQNAFLVVDGEQIIEKTIEQFMATVPGTQLLVDEIPQENEFSGTVGFPGKVTGRVALLYRQEQIKGIPEGAILASPMTTPDFLPALQRAAAFITDEGGMLSHAAIVARELRKPCIIGTKIATQVLHDGDLVEVDADQGVVRIIRELEVVSKSAISGQ